MTIRYEFDWDPAKAAANIVKHGVAFDDVLTVFADPLALSVPDDSELSEERWVTIGFSRTINIVLVVHTYVEIGRDRAYIRIISARKPTKRERRQYEQKPD